MTRSLPDNQEERLSSVRAIAKCGTGASYRSLIIWLVRRNYCTNPTNWRRVLIEELKEFYVGNNVIHIPSGTVIHAIAKGVGNEQFDPPNTSGQQNNTDKKPEYARRR